MTAPVSADVSPGAGVPRQKLALVDGRCATIRPVLPADAALEQAFVRSLSAASRRNRFHGAINELTDRMLRYLTCVDQRKHVGLVLTVEQDGAEAVIGDARYVVEADGETAEIAVAVSDAWQGLGLARRLIEALVRTAKASGLCRLVGEVLASNARTLTFIERCGFVRSTRGADPGVVAVQRTLVSHPAARHRGNS